MSVKVDRKTVQMAALSLVIALGIVTYETVTQADSHDNLAGIRIIPNTAEELTINTGESIRLTAEGDYTTMFARIRADWSIVEGGGLAQLSGCSHSKTCTVEAGSEGGAVTIQAEANDFTAQAVVTIVAASPFADELPGWASEAIVRLNDLGIVQGYDDGRFGPGDPVTRGQIVTLLSRLLLHTGLDQGQWGSCDVTDVPVQHYAHDAVCIFSDRGWTTATEFHPDDPASRGMTAAFVNRVFGATLAEAMNIDTEAVLGGGQIFDDVPEDHVFFADTAIMNATGIMTGYPNGDFGPDDNIDRAQTAVVIDRILQRVEELGIEQLLEGPQVVPGDEPPGPAAGLADLTVTSIEVFPRIAAVGTDVTFTFQIANEGRADAASSYTQVRIDRYNDGSWNMGVAPETVGIAAGQERQQSYTWRAQPAGNMHHLPAGTHKVEVCANYALGPFGGEVEESNYENNCQELLFGVGG